MFPSIPLTYRDREKECSRLDSQYIDRKNTLHAHSATNSTPHSRDVHIRLMSRLDLIPQDDITAQLKICEIYFSEIIDNTKPYKKDLEDIKSSYEEFIFSEGDQVTDPLPAPSSVSLRVTKRKQEIENSHLHVGKKETEVYRLYDGNKRLREELSHQIKLIDDLEAQNRLESREDLMTISQSLPSTTLLSNLPQKEQVERLHMLYDEQEEIICDLKDELKSKYAPAVECKQVEMCIKDVEVSIQKENRVNESLTTHLDDLVQQVHSLLSELSFPERDIDLIIQSILNNTVLSLSANHSSI